MRVACLLLLLLSAPCLIGCGDDGGSAPASVAELEGPPRWRKAPQTDEQEALTLRVRSPVRVRLRRVATDRLESSTGWRPLAAGQTLQVRWGGFEQAPDERGDRPGQADMAAGRTEPQALSTQYQFSDRALSHDRIVQFTRPGKGAASVTHVLPPGRYEDLAFPGAVELMTVVLSDLAEGEVSVRRRDGRVVVTPPRGLGPEDRILEWRLYLDVEPIRD